ASGWGAPLAVAAGAAAAAALVLGLLAWWSGGAAGPGRLADVGPMPLPVAGIAAATVGIGALVGAHAGHFRGGARRAAPSPGHCRGRRADDDLAAVGAADRRTSELADLIER